MNKRKAAVLCVFLVVLAGMPVHATTINELQKQKEEAQKQLNSANSNASQIQGEKKKVEGELSELDGQLVELLMTLEILEQDLEKKNQELLQAQEDYDAAKAQEEAQYEAMKLRIKFMYEKGDTMYLQLFLEAKSISDLINKVDYADKLYAYDRDLLLEYQAICEEVAALEEELRLEKSELEAMQGEYEEEKIGLESLISQKRATVENFDEKLSAARAQAKVYEQQIRQQDAKIKVIVEEQRRAEEAARKAAAEAAKKAAAEEAARKKAAEEAAKKGQSAASAGQAGEEKKEESAAGTSSSSSESSSGGNEDTGSQADSSSDSSSESSDKESPKEPPPKPSNSGTGQKIADYGLKFVGNPYVAGGTSLTEGADCSGFTMAVHQNFGIAIPRNSSSQFAGGKAVDYEDALPGDIICYAGHVGIYIGGGRIVHASTPATGIRTVHANYRTILGVRRYW